MADNDIEKATLSADLVKDLKVKLTYSDRDAHVSVTDRENFNPGAKFAVEALTKAEEILADAQEKGSSEFQQLIDVAKQIGPKVGEVTPEKLASVIMALDANVSLHLVSEHGGIRTMKEYTFDGEVDFESLSGYKAMAYESDFDRHNDTKVSGDSYVDPRRIEHAAEEIHQHNFPEQSGR